MSRSIEARLRAIEREIKRRRGANIPPAERWWCDGCQCTEEQRQACLSEPYTWADFERDWHAAEGADTHDKTGSIESDAS